MGLSPRVRGNLASGPSGGLWVRSIPACAGEPGWRSCSRAPIRVYPRVCGGTARNVSRDYSLVGLSPRVRGNRLDVVVLAVRDGSIPARAGEPRFPRSSQAGIGVYPRVCGGTVDAFGLGVLGQGLSPRVRGNLSFAILPGHGRRSIPACAGEPGRCAAPSLFQGVYPRV